MAGDYTYKSDYVLEATTVLLIPDYRDSSDLVAIISSNSQQFQDLEDDLRDILEQTLIPNAEGVQLDRIGKVVGQPRWGRTDEDYRELLNARILANASGATINELLAIVSTLITDALGVLTFEQLGSAHYQISWQRASSTAADRGLALDALIEVATAAGVSWSLIETVTDDSPRLTFDAPGQGFDQGKFQTRRLP